MAKSLPHNLIEIRRDRAVLRTYDRLRLDRRARRGERARVDAV